MILLSILRQIRYGLPVFHKEWSTRYVKDRKVREVLLDKRTHVLATCMAAYPTTSTKKLAEEFGISPHLIRSLAMLYGIKKDPKARAEINRDNAQGHPAHNSRQVEKLDLDGNVIAIYASVTMAARLNGVSHEAIRRYINGKIRRPMNGMYVFRFHRTNNNKKYQPTKKSIDNEISR